MSIKFIPVEGAKSPAAAIYAAEAHFGYLTRNDTEYILSVKPDVLSGGVLPFTACTTKRLIVDTMNKTAMHARITALIEDIISEWGIGLAEAAAEAEYPSECHLCSAPDSERGCADPVCPRAYI